MSDNYICIIPTDPWYIPETHAQQLALSTLKQDAPEADEIKVCVSDVPTFIDCGANFERVVCPTCKTVLNEWWQTAMDRAATTNFRDLMIMTPCCRTHTSLNDLRYEWPAGFARFVLEAQNPNIGLLNVHQIHRLSQILGCRVRQILVHI